MNKLVFVYSCIMLTLYHIITNKIKNVPKVVEKWKNYGLVTKKLNIP